MGRSEKLIKKVLRYPSSTRPLVWVVEVNGKRAVVKDYRLNGFFYRNIVGRFLIWREKKAYMRLRGVEGVPYYYGSYNGLTLLTEEVQGKPIEEIEKRMNIHDDFFVKFDRLVDTIHKRGVAHCDLKRAGNVIMGNDGNPYIIDWSSAIFESEFRFFPLNFIYRRFILDDLNGVTKYRLRHNPERVSPTRMRIYTYRSPLERLVRKVRDHLRDLLKRLA